DGGVEEAPAARMTAGDTLPRQARINPTVRFPVILEDRNQFDVVRLGRLDDVVELAELLVGVDAFGRLKAVIALVAEHPQPQDHDFICLELGKMGVNAGFIHPLSFDIAIASAVGEDIVSIGAGEVVEITVQAKVNAAPIRKTRWDGSRGRRGSGLCAQL